MSEEITKEEKEPTHCIECGRDLQDFWEDLNFDRQKSFAHCPYCGADIRGLNFRW